MSFTTSDGKNFTIGKATSGIEEVPKPRSDAYVFGFAGEGGGESSV